MRTTTSISGWGTAVAVLAAINGCAEPSKPESHMTSPVTPPAAMGAPLARVTPRGKATTLQELRDRNPARWAGDSVRSAIRGYRADYAANRNTGRPRAGICEGLLDYFSRRNAWGRSLAIRPGRGAELLEPRCGGQGRKVRFFSAAFHRRAPEGEEYVTERSMGLLDSLVQATARVDAADPSADQAVAMLTSEIDRIETLAANSSLTSQEYELVETTISGLIGTIAEAQAMVPAVLQDISGSIDACVQRLGYRPDDPDACGQEFYEVLGPRAYQVPRPVLMCAIAMNKSPAAIPAKVCDGHEIIEGMAHGFIGGAVGGAWAGLIGTGGLGVPLTALLGGIGGATSGLAVGLAKSFWCEWTK